MAEAKKTSTKKRTEEVPADTSVIAPGAAEVTEVAKAPAKKKATAKAGKRSEKALKETEQEQKKQERKQETSEEEADKPKKVIVKARSKLERRSKKYQKAAELIEKGKSYALRDALDLAVKTSTTKFDATVELHVNLNVDPKQADQYIRQTVVLPAGSGKKVRIAVFADVDDAKKALAAGADIAGGDEFLQQLDANKIDFEVLIATPTMMAKLGKYARLLGPKGLMPNPKSGTVTANVEKAVKEAKSGKIEYRVDSTGIIHIGIGKVSFGIEKLTQNAQALLASVKAAKPASLKMVYVNSVYTTTTMGPSVSINPNEV